MPSLFKRVFAVILCMSVFAAGADAWISTHMRKKKATASVPIVDSFETWSGGLPTGWANACTGTINQDATNKSDGTYGVQPATSTTDDGCISKTFDLTGKTTLVIDVTLAVANTDFVVYVAGNNVITSGTSGTKTVDISAYAGTGKSIRIGCSCNNVGCHSCAFDYLRIN